jgi:hypothetical protein
MAMRSPGSNVDYAARDVYDEHCGRSLVAVWRRVIQHGWRGLREKRLRSNTRKPIPATLAYIVTQPQLLF